MAGMGVRVYLDENVDIHLTGALRRRGYDAIHALLEGNVQVKDEQHLRYATAQGRALVTHDFVDFPQIHSDFMQRSEYHEGSILLPFRSLSELLARVSIHLNTIPPDAQRDNILWA